jgi:hypothetical protein
MLNHSHDDGLMEEELKEGTFVFDENGDKVGRVSHSVLSQDYFVVERGWLMSHKVFLPRSVIHQREARGITLSLAKEDLHLERWKSPLVRSLSEEARRPSFPPAPQAGLQRRDQGVVQAPSAVRPQPEHLTPQASLEAVAGLGEEYLLTGAGDEWTAGELLRWLQAHQPQSVHLSVYLVPPEANREGAIYELSPQGDVLPQVPLYRIERRQPTVLPL